MLGGYSYIGGVTDISDLDIRQTGMDGLYAGTYEYYQAIHFGTTGASLLPDIDHQSIAQNFSNDLAIMQT